MPTFRDGKVWLAGVFASAAASERAADAWTLARTGRLTGMSIIARAQEFFRGPSGSLRRATLVSVDLVSLGADAMGVLAPVVAPLVAEAAQAARKR